MSFIDKVVLITGASSGIGAACAVMLAKQGASLALVGRNADKFERVVSDINDINEEIEPLIILADISTEAERIIDETIKKFGKIDVLINNAGVTILATVERALLNDFDTIVSTNVRAALQLTQLAIPHLIESHGNILNVSSVFSMRPIVRFTSFCMTKSAMDQFTRCAALELAPKGVRVNSVNPGVIITDFYDAANISRENQDVFFDNIISQLPINRAGMPDDVAQAILFLINDRLASYITGVCLPVDGGWLLTSACQ